MHKYGGHERRGECIVEDKGWRKALEDLAVLGFMLLGVLAAAKILLWVIGQIA